MYNSNTDEKIVNEIKRLSQEEGLKDYEIADILKYHPVSIARIRKKYNIPSFNKNNRKDKSIICPICKSSYFIRRNEKASICCPDCAIKLEAKMLERE
jgi:uncharacterized CHY-type Zn-finger protein